MDLTIVGHCPLCGCPIYSQPLIKGIMVPPNLFSCKCQENKLTTNIKILEVLEEIKKKLIVIQTHSLRGLGESVDSENII